MSDLSGWSRRSVHGLAALAAVAGVVALGWRGRRVVVHGASMSPTLATRTTALLLGPGLAAPDRAAGRGTRPTRPAAGCWSSGSRRSIAGTEQVTVVGDNPGASTDSRVFGPVATGGPSSAGCVYRYAPADRAGRVR